MAPLQSGRFTAGLCRTLAVAGGIAMTMMMLHIVVDVAMKHTLNDPIDGTTEIVAAYYMVATVFLPLAYVTLTEGHLIVELFTGGLRGRPLDLFEVFAGIVTLSYVVFVIWCTAEEAVLRTAQGEAWETSVDLVAVWPSRWMLPLGLAAMALVVLVQTVRHLRRGIRPEPEVPGGV